MELRQKKDEKRNQPDPAPDRGDFWIWHCVDATSRLRIANHISKRREIADAKPFLARVAKRLASPEVLFITDKLKSYQEAMLDVFGIMQSPVRNPIGRPRKAQKIFPEGLLHGQLVKEREHGHLVCTERRALVGTMDQIKAVLETDSCKVISTSRVERDNLTVRQHNGRVVRKTLSYSKDTQMHQHAINFEDAVHNFVRPHLSLRSELPQPRGLRKWQQRTPAVVANLTDRPWSIKELVTYRLPSRL
jgi:IS1 family transposase